MNSTKSLSKGVIAGRLGGSLGMAKRTPKPRVIEPSRNQGVIRFELPEESLPPEHPVRVLGQIGAGKKTGNGRLDGSV